MFQDYFHAASFALPGAGAAAALLFRKKHRAAGKLGCIFLLAGLVAGMVHPAADFTGDVTGNLFRLPILLLGAAGGIHSLGYLKGHGEERSGIYWFFYNVTVISMLAVTFCQRPLTFLVAWEAMGMASFALVAFDREKREVARAAWIYLLACQAGSMFLIGLFVFEPSPCAAFILALLGFGLKIGFPLLHIWLPEAHPAAPAPVSSLMSGAMIHLGFLGIIRWGVQPASGMEFIYGVTFLLLGCTGALGGILYALPRGNLKTALAYSSVENMGIISIGMGMGFLGLHYGNPVMASGGFAGAALHGLNHALLKGALFLEAGSVLKATGTLDLDRMGGLLVRMPGTGTFFLLNAAGISGLPPFNAFISEFLIYGAALAALTAGLTVPGVLGMGVLVILALTGGIAAAVFAKAASGAFLGEPRSPEAAKATEVPATMVWPPAVLTFLGAAALFLPPVALMTTEKQLGIPLQAGLMKGAVITAAVSTALTVFAVLLFLLRSRGKQRSALTWDCGYAAPDARMEYTATAFSQPLTDFLRGILGCRTKVKEPEGIYPDRGNYTLETGDPGMTFWEKIFNFFAKIADKVHSMQSGSLHLYIVIMTLALLLLLVWALVLPWGGNMLKGGL